jgi:hypothetical protein
MAKKRAKQDGNSLTGKQRTATLTEQQRLRRAELKVQRVEVQLYNKTGRDVTISQRLEELGRGERGEYIKEAIIEKIAREIVARDAQAARDAEFAALLKRITELEQENAELLMSGAMPIEEETPEAVDQARHDALSGKLKKISFAGLMH